MEYKPYDYERDEALRDALKLVADRRERVLFWDCGRSEGVVKCERVADYLRDELRKVYGGIRQW
jgi:hypothetical protein